MPTYNLGTITPVMSGLISANKDRDATEMAFKFHGSYIGSTVEKALERLLLVTLHAYNMVAQLAFHVNQHRIQLDESR